MYRKTPKIERADILGILPAGGLGSRLGMPFQKVLAPTFTHEGIKPLYWHAERRLRRITDSVAFIIDPEARSVFGEKPGRVLITRQGEAKGNVTGEVARVAELAGELWTTLAIALPDSVWFPEDALETALKYHAESKNDITLLTMDAECTMLDHVVEEDIIYVETHHDSSCETSTTWNGWFAVLAKREVIADWEGELSWAANINKSVDVHQMGQSHFENGEYYDLGTPERYEKYIAIDKHDRLGRP
jgi:molybdopterin-guanine dinucleotide biosynthesis protein A